MLENIEQGDVSFFSYCHIIENLRHRVPLVRVKRSRGDSSIITTLILTGTVIAIGIILLGYFSSVSAVRQNDYLEQTVEAVQKIQERFIIETVEVVYKTGSDSVVVWVYNYGPVNINITITRFTIFDNETKIEYKIPSSTDLWTIESGQLASNIFDVNMDLTPGDIITTEVTTSRGNKANDITKIQPKK